MRRPVLRQQSLIVPEIQNPFVHKLHLGYLDMLRVGVMTVTVLPIRLLLIGLTLLLAWPLAAVAVGFRTEEDQKEPLKGWRRSFEAPLMFLGRVMTFFWGMQNVKVRGTLADVNEAPVLAVAPHSTLFDPMVLFYCKEMPSALSRTENVAIPIVSALLKFTQPVLVKREDPNSRQNTIQEIQRRARTKGDWPQVIIFPEGTCTNRSCLITFKLGAFYPGVPVQPVCVRYPNRIDTVTWTWDGPGAFTLLWLTLCSFNTNLEIEFLPVYTPSEAEKEDPKLFANNVRAVIAKALKCPITDHTFEDCRLLQTARDLNIPFDTAIVEFQKIHQKLGLSLKQLQEMLKDFKALNISGTGRITYSEFAKNLQVPESPALREVFDMYDRDGSGSIDFREYVIGVSLVSAPVNTESTVSLAFQLFDTSNQGSLSLEDLTNILHNAFGMTEVDVESLFKQIDADKDGKICYDEFKAFAKKKPEYASLFVEYQKMKEDATAGSTPTVTDDTSGHIKSE